MTTETTLTSDTIPVRETHRFDVDALERYLGSRVPGFAGPVTVSQFQGGQSNPTYRLSTPGHEYVLRRKPPGKLLPSAHAVDREYRILTTLGPTDVPVPKTYVLCEDPEVIGTIFYLMDWIEGRIMVDPIVPGCTPAERAAIYDSMNDVLARLHKQDRKTLGHPLADLAYNAMPYHLEPDVLGGVLGQDLKALGIPTEEEYLAAYCRRTGRTDIPDWSFYVAFSMFRLSAIAQGIMGRVLAGTANDAQARSRGERARPMAEAGWAIVEGRK